MVAEFMRFYPGHTFDAVMNMYAITFYALVSAAHRLEGRRDYDEAIKLSAATARGEALTSYLDNATNRSMGVDKILDEVRTVRGLRRE